MEAVDGSSERQLTTPVGGSGGWQGEKTSEIFVSNELKSPKNNMFFLFFYTLGWWVIYHFFWYKNEFFRP